MVDYSPLAQLIEKYQDYHCIVEGKKDHVALEHLGFKNVVLYNKPAWRIAENLEREGIDKVLLLMDLDSAGKKKYGELKSALTRHGIMVIDELRHWLFKNTTVSHIEGLDTFVRNHVHKV